MKNYTILVFFLTNFFIVQSINAQNPQDSVIVTIETKSAGTHSGILVSETADSIHLKTADFGILAIAKNQIVVKNIVSVETNDGNEYIGELIREDENVVVIKTQQIGEITIFRTNIKKMEFPEVQQIKDGNYWFPNPQSTRYFWSPNGYGLKQGEGYYQNIWVVWNQFAYGINDVFSVGGGIIPTFLFGAPTPVFGTLKLSIPVVQNKFNIAGGAIVGYVIGEEDTGLGIVYGLGTYGSPDANLTFGLGYGFASGGWTQAPIVNINGMVRVSRRGYIVTENYVLTGDGESVVLLTFGGRSILKKIALDYGLIIPVTSDGIPLAFPWLGISIPFGKTN